MEAKIEAKIYSQKGEEVGKLALPLEVFGAKWRSDLVHQVVEGMRSNKRSGTADTKDRGEVRGGGRKPWKQKGTGKARHGSTRSPIWVGGGVTHGPLAEKNYKRKITKSMRAQALFSVLSRKLKDGELIFIDSLSVSEVKTKNAAEVMKNLSKVTGYKEIGAGKKKKVLTAIYDKNEKSSKSFRNLPQIEMAYVKNLNPLDVLNHKYLLIEKPEDSVKFLASRA
jgi:large subunit ribosomal protein L4